MNFLMMAAEPNTPFNYFPIALQIVVARGFVVVMMVVTHLLGPKRKTQDKLVNFESGIPSVGNARQPMGIKYFLVAILFGSTRLGRLRLMNYQRSLQQA